MRLCCGWLPRAEHVSVNLVQALHLIVLSDTSRISFQLLKTYWYTSIAADAEAQHEKLDATVY